jgi:hypothetical protein
MKAAIMNLEQYMPYEKNEKVRQFSELKLVTDVFESFLTVQRTVGLGLETLKKTIMMNVLIWKMSNDAETGNYSQLIL